MAVPMAIGMVPFLKKEVDLLPIALQINSRVLRGPWNPNSS